MQDFRCTRCNRLLARYQECQELEIKCPRCGSLNQLADLRSSVNFSLIKEKCRWLDHLVLYKKEQR